MKIIKSNNLKWICVFLIIILICASFIFFNRNNSRNVEILIDGKLYKTIDNIYCDKEQCFTVETKWGKNEIHWLNGEIWVESSDCGNQTCVHMGKISSSGRTIICVPHKLVIKFTDNKQTVDAEV